MENEESERRYQCKFSYRKKKEGSNHITKRNTRPKKQTVPLIYFSSRLEEALWLEETLCQIKGQRKCRKSRWKKIEIVINHYLFVCGSFSNFGDDSLFNYLSRYAGPASMRCSSFFSIHFFGGGVLLMTTKHMLYYISVLISVLLTI